MIDRWLLSSVIAVATVATGGCSNRIAPLPAVPAAGVGPASPIDDVALTGTYTGSVKEVEGSHARSGTVVITIKQSSKSFSGTFDIKFASGHSYDLSISGAIKSKTKKGESLSITLTFSKGNSAKGSATLASRKLRGKATASAKSGTAIITFSTKKKGKPE
jgi:hypothetical protein